MKRQSFIHILKELKYATHKISYITYVFDVFIKSPLDMSCRLLVACDETRKRHFFDKIYVKTSKTMKKSNCDVNVRENFNMQNVVRDW